MYEMVINVKEVTKTLPIMQFCVFSQSTKIIVVINLLLLLHYAYIIRVLIIHNFFPIKELQHTVFIPTSTYKEAILYFRRLCPNCIFKKGTGITCLRYVY